MNDEGFCVFSGFVMGAFVLAILIGIIMPGSSQRQAITICSAAGYDMNMLIGDEFYCASGGDGADIVSVESLIKLLKEYKEG